MTQVAKKQQQSGVEESNNLSQAQEGDTLLACRRCSFQRRADFKACIFEGWPVHCGIMMRLVESRVESSNQFNLVSEALAWALSLLMAI